MDVFPTVAKLCGAQVKNPPDGIDIWPLMTSAAQEVPRGVVLYFDDVHMQCARLGNWKLHFSRYNSEVYSPAPQGGRKNIRLKNPELYDLIADPEESYDAADKNPRIVADIQARVEKLMAGFPEDIRKAWEEANAKPASVAPAGAVSRAPAK
jgi:arylsulfatase A